jgi:hypothetical protein
MPNPTIKTLFAKKFDVLQFADVTNHRMYKKIARNTRVRGFVQVDGSCTCVQCKITSKFAAKYRHRCERRGAHHDLVYVKETGKYGIMTVDHILPKSLGGGNQQTNYRVMCDDCNSRRGNQLKYWEFLQITTNPDQHIRHSDEGRRKFRQYVEQRYPERLETLSYFLY